MFITTLILLGLKTIFYSDFFLSLIPGWNTTIYPISTFMILFIFVVIIIAIYKLVSLFLNRIFIQK